MFLSYKIQS